MRRRSSRTTVVVELSTLMIVFVIALHGFLLFEKTGALHSTISYSDYTRSRRTTNQHRAIIITTTTNNSSSIVPVWLELTNRKRKFNNVSSVLSASASIASDDESIITYKNKEGLHHVCHGSSKDEDEDIIITEQQQVLHRRRRRRRHFAVLSSGIIVILVLVSSSTMSVFPKAIGKFFASINSFFKCYPFIASFLICAFKASSADAVAQFMSFNKKSSEVVPYQQQQQENKNKKNDDSDTATTATNDSSSITTATTTTTMSATTSSFFSFKRNLALLFYGGLYQGCGQQLIYNNLFSKLFGCGRHPRIVMMKVCFDMLLVQPGISLPIAYLIKAPIFGYSLTESIHKYINDIQQQNLLKHCWLVWAPTQIISFTIIPTHLRISFMACISFFWIILFSSISSSSSSSSTTTTTTTTI